MYTKTKYFFIKLMLGNSIASILAYFLLIAIAAAQVLSLFFWNYLYAVDIHRIVVIIFWTTLIVSLPILFMFGYILKDVGRQYDDLTRSQSKLKEQKLKLTTAMTKLEEARDIAIEASEAKSRFLANMSHEIRTPLNAIIGYTELLPEEFEVSATPQALEDLEKVQNSGKQLLDLVNDILDLAKIEAGKDYVNYSLIHLKLMVSETVDVIRPLLNKNNNTIIINHPNDVKEVLSDPGKLRRCLINLLSNASKFTKDGTITLSIHKKNMSGRNYILFSVSDTGIGMTDEEMGRIFEYFTQADETTTRRFGGSGLGLTITRKLIRLMEGDIKVSSEKGKGSTFTIMLPQDIDIKK